MTTTNQFSYLPYQQNLLNFNNNSSSHNSRQQPFARTNKLRQNFGKKPATHRPKSVDFEVLKSVENICRAQPLAYVPEAALRASQRDKLRDRAVGEWQSLHPPQLWYSCNITLTGQHSFACCGHKWAELSISRQLSRQRFRTKTSLIVTLSLYMLCQLPFWHQSLNFFFFFACYRSSKQVVSLSCCRCRHAKYLSHAQLCKWDQNQNRQPTQFILSTLWAIN